MPVYRGIVRIKEGKCTLDANGIIVNLEGDLSLFKSLDGIFTAVAGEQQGDSIRNAVPASLPEAAAVDTDSSTNLEPVIAAIKSVHEQLLAIPGVLGVRPGFSEDDAAPPAPVIVVITDPGKDSGPVPPRVNGIKVEVRKATALDIIDGIAPLSTWESEGVAEAVPNINYTPPDDVSLDRMEVSDITCHVGPDSGWTTLKPFLEGTTKTLTVAMYEFYADHIIDTIKSLGEETDVQLDMILQVDKNDKTLQSKLSSSWGDRLNLVAASVSGPNRLFNNSYHTKVAVRDSKAVWVSSGNWSPNSQPLIKAGTENALYKNGNREWHVIIRSKNIAEMYEKFIRYDMLSAAAVAQMESAPLMPDLLVPESFFAPEAAVLQDHPFNPQTFASGDEKVMIEPLMSPDNYAAGILKLIESAKKSLYLQFSYINQPSTGLFDKIIDAVALKMKEGIDVRVIAGASQKSESSDLLIGKRKWKRSMFRIQKSKLHNKGVLVDGKAAVVGSNNWSSDGTQFNRDTSIIFYSRPIAKYYTEVFMFDWDNLTREVGKKAEMAPILAPETGMTPPGMVRVPWQTWFND